MTDSLRDAVAGNWRRGAHVLGAVVLVVVVALFVAASFPPLAGADESYVVLSDSMSPAIKAGAVVFVSDVPTDQIEEGDVVTYERGDSQPVTHRVVDVVREDGERQFVTKGDANEDADSTPVSANAVVGTVSFHVPLIGYVVAFAGTDLGLVTLVVIPAALLVVLEVRDLLQGTDDQSTDWEGKL